MHVFQQVDRKQYHRIIVKMHAMFSNYHSDIGACFFSRFYFILKDYVHQVSYKKLRKGFHQFFGLNFGDFEIYEKFRGSNMDGASNHKGDDLWGENINPCRVSRCRSVLYFPSILVGVACGNLYHMICKFGVRIW